MNLLDVIKIKQVPKHIGLLAILFIGASTALFAQEKNIKLLNERLELRVNEQMQLQAQVVDENGEVLPDTVVFFSRARRSLAISREGEVKALKPGTHAFFATTLGENRIRENFELQVLYPPITSIEWTQKNNSFYAGTKLDLNFSVEDSLGTTRSIGDVRLASTNPEIMSVNDFGQLIVHRAGKASLQAITDEQMIFDWAIEVKNNPANSIELDLTHSTATIRTGDVVQLQAIVLDNGNNEVKDAPVQFSYIAYPDDQLGQGSSAQIAQDGRFVANDPGHYTLVARSGNLINERTIRVDARKVRRNLEVVGKGIVPDVKTSDLWVWEGVDGRDYAITGTWGARGEAFLWDVTDPSNIHTIDTVQVDARTVNDVKVSEDGTIAVITREGASNRKNGIIILDVTNPAETKILSEYTDGLTGGVHNTFIYENHVYAVNNGRKYDIINIEDPTNPYTVGVFELDTPGHSIHDVWIEDGIAYSSNWSDGVVVVDVGSNSSADMPGAGGSPQNPTQLGSYTYPSGWNHAAFPFKSESTGKFFVAAGDEAFPYGLDTQGPNRAAGWIHFIEFDGWESPDEVARYQVPEAGSHNYWIEDDVMYAAFYNGGLRVVDVSGELMGDLYEQGREIALFLPSDPKAAIPNSTFTWGPQPYKGLIYLSDWNSGIWAVKLGDLQE
jgi:hypothetical protein